MATRSRIGMKNSDGTITSIYCHWDGYPTYNGRILLENYTNEKTVCDLMKLGYISFLGRSPIAYRPNQIDNHRFTIKESVRTRELKSDNFGGDRCMPHSLRGEYHPAVVNTKVEGMVSNSNEEYEYLYKNNTWFFRKCDYPSNRWTKLEKHHVMDND